MAGQRSRAQLELENQMLRRHGYVDSTARVLITLIKSVAAVFFAYFGFRAIEALAGQMTLTDIVIRILGDIRTSTLLSWLVGIGGVIYGLVQRRLRKDSIERLQERNQSLERNRDQRRSSSKLTSKGNTRPEDKHD